MRLVVTCVAMARSLPRRPSTPTLDRLTTDERGQLLGELLVAHPEVAAEAERLAVSRLATVDADEVAEDIEWTLREADADQLSYRAGRVRGRGYVHVDEAAGEILQELLQPELDDLVRRADLGLHDAARQMALGLLRGLANCQHDVEAGTVLAYAGPDVTDDLAWCVRDELAKAHLDLPEDLPEDLLEDLPASSDVEPEA
ncbi:MAG: hypothetical protein M0Z82_03505 [Actinomycetota bacterium]|nr:hypothetical protein [Actinomycetota bacterium]